MVQPNLFVKVFSMKKLSLNLEVLQVRRSPSQSPVKRWNLIRITKPIRRQQAFSCTCMPASETERLGEPSAVRIHRGWEMNGISKGSSLYIKKKWLARHYVKKETSLPCMWCGKGLCSFLSLLPILTYSWWFWHVSKYKHIIHGLLVQYVHLLSEVALI